MDGVSTTASRAPAPAAGASGALRHDLIRRELRLRLAERGIGGYLPQTEANLYYVTGYQSGWIDMSWRWMGLETAFLPADPARDPVLLVCDYSESAARFQSDLAEVHTFGIWVECRDPDVVGDDSREARLARPEQYDPAEVFEKIRRMIAGCGLAEATIGTDLGVMRKETFDGLAGALPGCTFVDVSDLLYDMRKIKQPEEVRRLRNAAAVFDFALGESMTRVREGTTLGELRAGFDGAAIDMLHGRPDLGEYQGSFGFNSIGRGDLNRVRPGDIIKIDAGVRLSGYWSDCARVFCYGPPAEPLLRIHEALLAGFETALALMKPGTTMREIYSAALATVRDHGFPNYSRGHFGHSVGLDDQIEEPPFIGPNDTVLEEGMVLALEVPYYPVSVAGFNIEEIVLITPEGAESCNRAPRSLINLAS